MPEFTATQQKMLSVLADGLPHTRQELHACLPDELGRLENIQMHISNIRKKLRPVGQELVCEYINRQAWYRHVRLLASPTNGYR